MYENVVRFSYFFVSFFCFTVGGDNDQDVYDLPTSYLNGRRQRRMTLLQSLRYQNKQLADSGFELLPEEKSNKGNCALTS